MEFKFLLLAMVLINHGKPVGVVNLDEAEEDLKLKLKNIPCTAIWNLYSDSPTSDEDFELFYNSVWPDEFGMCSPSQEIAKIKEHVEALAKEGPPNNLSFTELNTETFTVRSFLVATVDGKESSHYLDENEGVFYAMKESSNFIQTFAVFSKIDKEQRTKIFALQEEYYPKLLAHHICAQIVKNENSPKRLFCAADKHVVHKIIMLNSMTSATLDLYDIYEENLFINSVEYDNFFLKIFQLENQKEFEIATFKTDLLSSAQYYGEEEKYICDFIDKDLVKLIPNSEDMFNIVCGDRVSIKQKYNRFITRRLGYFFAKLLTGVQYDFELEKELKKNPKKETEILVTYRKAATVKWLNDLYCLRKHYNSNLKISEDDLKLAFLPKSPENNEEVLSKILTEDIILELSNIVLKMINSDLTQVPLIEDVVVDLWKVYQKHIGVDFFLVRQHLKNVEDIEAKYGCLRDLSCQYQKSEKVKKSESWLLENIFKVPVETLKDESQTAELPVDERYKDLRAKCTTQFDKLNEKNKDKKVSGKDKKVSGSENGEFKAPVTSVCNKVKKSYGIATRRVRII